MTCLRPLALFILLAIPLSLPGKSREKALHDIAEYAQRPGVCFFDPPQDWELMDPGTLPKSVKIAIRCPVKNKFPPSMNLAVDRVSCDLKNYLKKIKALNLAEGSDFKELGTIDTQAGPASLSQLDMESNWGQVRMMHAILLHDHEAHILTVAALRDEFPEYQNLFFDAMRSLRINH